MSLNPSFYNPDRNQWYCATSLLGQGGQGVVWSGFFGPVSCAIKVQTDFKAWDLEQRIHLMCLDHDFIVRAYDQFRSFDGSLVLVMERADGNAQQVVNAGTRLTPMQVCRIGGNLASALETIHALRIRHRDITLKNVLRYGKDTFKLGDFGIARKNMAPDELAMTQVGTPGWYPPEVLKGEGSTPSSDVYQLGLVLLSLLLGRHIIPPTYTPQQMWDAILNGVPRLTAEQVIATHGETAGIIRNMLPRTPSLRHPSAMAVRLAFEAEHKAIMARESAALSQAFRTFAMTRNVPAQAPALPLSRALAGLQKNVPAQAPALPLSRVFAGPQKNAPAQASALPLSRVFAGPQKNARAQASALPLQRGAWMAAHGILSPAPMLKAGGARMAARGIGLQEPPKLGLLGLRPIPDPPSVGLAALLPKANASTPQSAKRQAVVDALVARSPSGILGGLRPLKSTP